MADKIFSFLQKWESDMFNNIREGDLVIQILKYVAEKAWERIRARQAQGIVTEKANNCKFGRPKMKKPVNWNDVIRQWQNGDILGTNLYLHLC